MSSPAHHSPHNGSHGIPHSGVWWSRHLAVISQASATTIFFIFGGLMYYDLRESRKECVTMYQHSLEKDNRTYDLILKQQKQLEDQQKFNFTIQTQMQKLWERGKSAGKD